MDGEKRPQLLERLSTVIDQRWPDVDGDRKMFIRGLRLLKEGDVEQAARVFRRATRKCAPPFHTMAAMAHGRCEAVRGRQGAALRSFRGVADSSAADGLRKMAWMEVADLGRQRGDDALVDEAQQAISSLMASAGDGPTGHSQ